MTRSPLTPEQSNELSPSITPDAGSDDTTQEISGDLVTTGMIADSIPNDDALYELRLKLDGMSVIQLRHFVSENKINPDLLDIYEGKRLREGIIKAYEVM